MSSLVITGDVAQRLRDIAAREQRPVEEVIAAALRDYRERPASAPVEAAALEAEAVEQERELRRKIYAMAREYWEEVGDAERLALTDAELNEQFWVIDHEGIPRLKVDQATVTLPPDPLDSLVGLVETGIPDLSMRVRETLAEHTHPRYGWTLKDDRAD